MVRDNRFAGHCWPAPTCRDGRMRSATAVRSRTRHRCWTTPTGTPARSPTTISPARWPPIPASVTGHEATRGGCAWSRQEQAGVQPGDELVEVNRAYEERFGRVFLICATGLTAADVVAAARARLANDDDGDRGGQGRGCARSPCCDCRRSWTDEPDHHPRPGHGTRTAGRRHPGPPRRSRTATSATRSRTTTAGWKPRAGGPGAGHLLPDLRRRAYDKDSFFPGSP